MDKKTHKTKTSITFKLTEEGRLKCRQFISKLEARRKEIIKAGIDSDMYTAIPSVSDIEEIISERTMEYGEVCFNSWPVTDHYDCDAKLRLEIGTDFRKDTNG